MFFVLAIFPKVLRFFKNIGERMATYQQYILERLDRAVSLLALSLGFFGIYLAWETHQGLKEVFETVRNIGLDSEVNQALASLSDDLWPPYLEFIQTKASDNPKNRYLVQKGTEFVLSDKGDNLVDRKLTLDIKLLINNLKAKRKDHTAPTNHVIRKLSIYHMRTMSEAKGVSLPVMIAVVSGHIDAIREDLKKKKGG